MTAPAVRSLLGGGVTMLGVSVVTRALALAQSVLVARLLDPHHVGLFAIVTYVVGVVAMIADLGIPTAAARLTAASRRDSSFGLSAIVRTMAALMVAVAIAAGMAVAVAAGWLARVYGEPSLAPLFRWAALFVATSLVGAVISGLLQGLERIERLAGIAILKGVLVLLGSAVLVPILGLVGVLVASTVAEVIAWCAALSPLHVAYRAASRGTLRAVDARMLWRAGGTALPVFLNGLALWGTALLVRSALATSGGFTDIGYFQIADSVARVVALVPAALAVPLMPLLASDPGRARTLVGPAIRIAVLGALLPALFLSVAAGPLIGALYGPVYLPAATIAAVLVFVAFLQTIGTIVWTVLVGGGNAWTGFAVQATGYVALAVLVMVLVPSFGLTGATSAYLASAAIATAASVWYLRRIPGATSPDLWRAGWIAALGWLLVAAWYVVGIVGALPALATVTIVAAVGWRPFGRTAFERVRVTLGRHAAA